MSKHTLTKSQIKLLVRGPKFYPTTKGNYCDFRGDTHYFTKKLIVQEKYFDKDYNDASLIRKPSKRYLTTNNTEMSNIISTIHKIEPNRIKMESNITIEEETALHELQTMTREIIEIKKADKANILVVMDKNDYKEKLVLRQHLETETYEKAQKNENRKVFKRLEKLVNKYNTHLTKQEKCDC